MFVKAIFVIFFVLFLLISFFIHLPPGTLVTETLNLSIPYSELITTNIFNGLFFAAIIGLVAYVTRRKTKPTLIYSSKTLSTDYDIEKLLTEKPKLDASSNLTQIKGIGPKSAIELELAGVTTIADLAKRSPQHLAEKTGIPITRVSKWIVEANKLTK
jgi:predicted flap endonuclease-1-like 5' DNA nuclease